MELLEMAQKHKLEQYSATITNEIKIIDKMIRTGYYGKEYRELVELKYKLRLLKLECLVKLKGKHSFETFEEIGEGLGVSKQRAEQIYTSAIKKAIGIVKQGEIF
mgnify:CR=1 FL=1